MAVLVCVLLMLMHWAYGKLFPHAPSPRDALALTGMNPKGNGSDDAALALQGFPDAPDRKYGQNRLDAPTFRPHLPWNSKDLVARQCPNFTGAVELARASGRFDSQRGEPCGLRRMNDSWKNFNWAARRAGTEKWYSV